MPSSLVFSGSDQAAWLTSDVDDLITDQRLEKHTHKTHQTILKKEPVLVSVFRAGIYKGYKNCYLPAYIYP